MMRRLRAILRNERGATAVEYSVMVVLIAAVIVVSVSFLGGTTSSTLECAGKSWQNKTTACTAGPDGSTVSPEPAGGGDPGGTTGGTTTGGSTAGGNGRVGQGKGQGNTKH